MLKNIKQKFFTFSMSFMLLVSIVHSEDVGVFFDSTISQHQFAAQDIKTALVGKGFGVEFLGLKALNSTYSKKKVVLSLANNMEINSILTAQGGSLPPSLGEQAYQIRTTTQSQTSYWVLGGDNNGVMYGGLQIAEYISFEGFSGIYDEKVTPDFLQRGAKLNLPMDYRIPTYSGFMNPTSAQKAIPHVWDINFWKTWIDHQARNRYNVLSVWVHHPFPAIVKVPEYPLAALPSIEGVDGFKRTDLTIEKRIAFWKEVMNYAHRRGFSFYFFCWNVTVDYAGNKLDDNGKVEKAGIYPNLTDTEDNLETIKYLKASMKALLETYPDLDGFGISAGDNMDSPKDDRPAWTWKAYGIAAYEYAQANPNRKFTIIHRGLGTALSSVYKDWLPLTKLKNFKFDYSIKYANAHMFSTVTPTWYSDDVKDASTNNQKTWLTLRNDDYFYLDMGDPKFVRDYLNNVPSRNVINSFYIGSDLYMPTMSFFYKNNALNNQLEIQRNWYIQMLWGRISYNKNISDNVFKKYMAIRFPQVSSDNLFTAWSLASRALPKFQELTQGNWQLDAHWFAEGSVYPCNKGNTCFRTVVDLGTTEVAKSTSLCDIPTSAAGGCGNKVTSYMIADTIENLAKSALSLITPISAGGNSDLNAKIQGVKQQAYLANYLAYKIRAGTYLKANKKTEATAAMAKTYCWWMTYTNSMDAMYVGNRFRTVGILPDWNFADTWILDDYKSVAGAGAATPKCEDLVAVSVDDKEKTLNKKQIVIQGFTKNSLVFSLPENGLATITVFNSTGKIIYQEKAFTGKTGLNDLKFNKKLGVGLHFVKVKLGNITALQRNVITSVN